MIITTHVITEDDFFKRLHVFNNSLKNVIICLKNETREVNLPENFDVGFDLWTEHDFSKGALVIPPFKPTIVPTGVKISLPPGIHAEVRARSSLPIKYNLIVGNSPGTIDPAYRGEMGLILINFSSEHLVIEEPVRLCQLCLIPYIPIPNVYCEIPNFNEEELKIYVVRSANIFDRFEKLLPSQRGSGGFGSTGK